MPAVTKHKIGETFSVGYWTYICDGTHWQNMIGSGYTAEMPDAAFLVVDLTIRNGDKTSSTLPPLKLVDVEGREYNESSKDIFMEHSFGMLKDVNPGVSSRGYVVFDVPRRGDYALKVSGGFESGEHTLVDLAERNENAPPSAGVQRENVFDSPELKERVQRLFGEKAAEIEGHSTGSKRVVNVPDRPGQLDSFAVFEFCLSRDSAHGGMMIEDIQSSRGEVAGILYDESEMVVYLGDYAYKENLPLEFRAWMANEVDKERATGHLKNIRYVRQGDQ